MSLLLALDATQIVLICLIGVLVIAYPILISRRNKKETQRMTEQTNSLKRGDKILTTSGVYGTILEVRQEGSSKQVTIETGSGKFKSYMTIDAYAIYQVIKDQPIETAKDITKSEDDKKEVEAAKKSKKSSKKEVKSEEKSQEKSEEKLEEKTEEKSEEKTAEMKDISTEKAEEKTSADKKPRRKKAN